jgi:hypothetical protein
MTAAEKNTVGDKIYSAKKKKDRRLGNIMDQIQSGRGR